MTEISDKKEIIKFLRAPDGTISFETADEFKELDVLIDLLTRVTDDLKFQNLVNTTTQHVIRNMAAMGRKAQEDKLVGNILQHGGFKPS